MIREEKEQIRRTLVAELCSSDDEITSLEAMVTKLKETMKSKSAEFEHLDFHLSLFENSNYNGIMIWKIPDFCRRKKDAGTGKHSLLYSPSLSLFSRSGYKMYMCVCCTRDSTGKGGTHFSVSFVLMKKGHGDLEFSSDNISELRRLLLKEKLHEFLWRQKALRQKKSLECNASAPLDVRWLEFHSLLLLAYGDVERNPGPLTRKSTLCYTLIVLVTKLLL
jgi:TNF receptor-associated factor 2